MATSTTTRVQLRVVNRIDDVLARVHRYERYIERERYIRQVESFAAAIGARPWLTHMSATDWMKHRAANEDAYGAVLLELAGTD